jgi:hypothetical protein
MAHSSLMTHHPEECLFQCNSIEELKTNIPAVIACVRERGFASLRGLFGRDEIRACRAAVYDYANRGPHLATAGVSRETVRTNMSKWSIGSQSAMQAGISRSMLTVNNPMFCADRFGLRKHFRQLIVVRDLLAERNEPLFDENLPPPLFNGTRVQIYPKGGGFMTAHRDTRAEESLSGVSGNYMQLVMLLSERGTDYRTGGAFVVNDSGTVIDTEKNSLSGDVLVYDGNTLHGVMDIDSAQPLTTSDLAGRAVALVTVYN